MFKGFLVVLRDPGVFDLKGPLNFGRKQVIVTEFLKEVRALVPHPKQLLCTKLVFISVSFALTGLVNSDRGICD